MRSERWKLDDLRAASLTPQQRSHMLALSQQRPVYRPTWRQALVAGLLATLTWAALAIGFGALVLVGVGQ